MSDQHPAPYGSVPSGYQGPKRSLILSGGGMRLSYQAGVIRALFEEGLCFDHMDGTSGGSLNLAMLLSGLSPDEMCARWRTQDPRDFVSLMPMQEYLKAGNLTAMGDADGVVEKVLPHLGIDTRKINQVTGVEGTFNVCNYSRKVNEVVSHRVIDTDLLVAGMSLPGVMPPVVKGGQTYIDSAFLQDANLMEAVRRGAEELWVVWCMGNSASYRGGPLHLYVQMLEMSANGALNIELERIRELNQRIESGETVPGREKPVRLHLIRPEYPLPLDPDLYLGRIDHSTLIEMGYAEAKKYLRARRPEGVPLQPETLQMKAEGRGIRFHETLSGKFAMGATDPAQGARSARAELVLRMTVEIRDIDQFVADPSRTSTLTGRISFPDFGENIPVHAGEFNVLEPANEKEAKLIRYGLAFDHGGESYYLTGRKEMRDDPGFDLLADATTAYVVLHRGAAADGPVVGAGILRLGAKAVVRLVKSMTATNAKSLGEKARTLSTFGRMLLGEIWNSHINPGGS